MQNSLFSEMSGVKILLVSIAALAYLWIFYPYQHLVLGIIKKVCLSLYSGDDGFFQKTRQMLQC